jgi:uncharacterized membrane protein YcaP (DUF421 family)
MEDMLFDGSEGLVRTLVVGVAAYLALVALLRISGKRTLSKMNAFDLVVTVALGSTLATVLLSRDVPLADGVLGFFVLVGMQFLITASSRRWQRVSHAVRSEPRALLYRGRILPESLRAERVLEEEVQAALRQHGFARYDDVDLLVLETDGSFTAIASLPDADAESTSSVLGVPGR